MPSFNILCYPDVVGITRWRYLNCLCPIYFNRLYGQIQFNKCFDQFGFKRGVKIVILEHFSDPIGKALFSIAKPDQETYAYTLTDWNKNGVNTKPGMTSFISKQFFKTFLIPELDKTKVRKNGREIGEKGFYINAIPLNYNNWIYFEIDFNLARSPNRKRTGIDVI